MSIVVKKFIIICHLFVSLFSLVHCFASILLLFASYIYLYLLYLEAPIEVPIFSHRTFFTSVAPGVD